MADIFVSYRKTDKDAVATIVRLLEAEGWTVWWDTRLRAGETWDKMIETEITAAKAVVVIWSPASVDSKWVREEASFGRDKGNLMPICIGGAAVPFGYSRIQAANLSGWRGEAGAEVAQRLVADLQAMIGAPTPSAVLSPTAPPVIALLSANAGSKAPRSWMIASALIALLVVGSIWVAWQRTLDTGSQHVATATPTPQPTDSAKPPPQPAPIDDCDKLAAPPYDKNALSTGARFEQIKPEAIIACQAAVNSYPHEVRFWTQLGRSLDHSKRYDEARFWYEKAAAAGDGQSMNNLGLLYYFGHGVPQDHAKAREWYEKAAAAGNGQGMDNLGALYGNGQGVPQDYVKAREWYEKAAAAGDGLGMNNLGTLYENGQGVPQDYVKAREWYEKAVAAGNVLGAYNLARLLEPAIGGPADYPRAASLLLGAAKSQEPNTLNFLHGDMATWTAGTRTELKRELARLGFYKGTIDGTWDAEARAAVDAYLKAPG